MAGRGPAPKPPQRRARQNRDPVGLRVITVSPVTQPDLPTLWVESDGELVSIEWPARTQVWWAMWAGSPLAAEFTATDWDFLLDTARVHAAFWMGRLSQAAELRLRVAKFGATPEDRARLRIQFAAADEAEEKRSPAARTARQRYRGLAVGE